MSNDEQFMPRNGNELIKLEAAGAQALAGMARTGMQAGQLPPRNVLDWYAAYLVNVLIAYEDTLKEQGSKLEPEHLDEMGKQLEMVVLEISMLVRQLEGSKQLVLLDSLKSQLKARQLYMTNGFDATYGGLIPA